MSKVEYKKEIAVPIIDLVSHYEALKDEIDAAVNDVLSSANYILGPNVTAFEQDLAKYLSCKNVIGCANGTDAIVLALKALGIGAGDEVITVSHSYFATSEAVALVGAEPVFVDIVESDFNIDVSKIEKAITKKTKCIIPVHLYGQSCEIEEVVKIANNHGLYVIEDCAQAIGAKYNGKMVGTFGNIGTTSFYPTKNLGCFGDGGALFTNDSALAEKIRLLRMHGSPKRYVHDIVGFNSRLDEIQAAILRIKLKHLDRWNQARKDTGDYFSSCLSGIEEIVIPSIKPNCTHIFHQYTIRTKSRDKLQEELKKKKIDTLIYYPIPIHKQKAFSYLKGRNYNLSVTERICNEILSLPMYPELDREKKDYICENIKSFFHNK